jgi:hypothetical protein
MRGFLAGVLIALGLVVVPLGSLGIWTSRDLLHTDSFVSLANDVVQEQDVKSALADRIVEEIVTLAPRLAVTQPLVKRGTVTAIGTSAFQTVFSGAATQMHTQLERGDDELSLHLDAVLPIIRTSVAELDPRVAQLVPRTGLPSITVVRRSDVPVLWRGVDLARTLSWVLPALALVLLAAGVLLARRRGRALVVAGVGVVVMAIVVIALLGVGRDVLSDVGGNQVSNDAFDAAWNAATRPFIIQTLLLALVGGLAAVGGAFVISRTRRNERPSGWA